MIITSDLAGNGYSGIVSGDSASVFQIGTTGSLVQVSFGAGASTQQFSGFTGTVRVFDGASLRFSSTSALNNGGTGTTFDLGTSGVLTARNSGTVNLGSLVGSGTVSGASGATGTTIYSIGAKNVSSTFNGSITDSAADRKASLTKKPRV